MSVGSDALKADVMRRFRCSCGRSHGQLCLDTLETKWKKWLAGRGEAAGSSTVVRQSPRWSSRVSARTDDDCRRRLVSGAYRRVVDRINNISVRCGVVCWLVWFMCSGDARRLRVVRPSSLLRLQLGLHRCGDTRQSCRVNEPSLLDIVCVSLATAP